MAFSYQALYRVRATTEGTGELRAMERDLSRIGPAASRSAGGVSVLGRALGDVGKIAAGIGLANLANRLMQFGGSAIQSGDNTLLVSQRIKELGRQTGETSQILSFAEQSAKRFTLSQYDASKAIADLYGRMRPMGISMKDIESSFNGINNMARLSGLSLQDTNEVFRQFAQAVGQGRLNGDEFNAIMSRMPGLGEAVVEVFNNIAKSKGLQQITRERADELIKEVKRGEKGQTEALEEETRRRIELMDKETDERMRKLQKRYDDERELLGDKLDEEQRMRDEKSQEEYSKEERRIRDKYDAQRKADRRAREDFDDERREWLESLSEADRKAYLRELEDYREAYDRRLSDREQAELDSLQRRQDAEKRQRAIADREARQAAEESINERQRKEEEAVRNSFETQKRDLQAKLQNDIQANKTANETIIANILARVKVTQGQLKDMAAEGLITPKMLVEATKLRESMKIPPPTPLQKWNAATADFSQAIGEKLLPALTPMVELATKAIGAFDRLPDPIKTTAVAVGTLATAVGALAAAVAAAGGIGALRTLMTLGRGGGGAAAAGAGRAAAAGGLPPALGGGRLPSGVPGPGPARWPWQKPPVPPETPAWARGPGMGPRIPTGTGPLLPGAGIPRTQPAWAVGPRGGGTVPSLPVELPAAAAGAGRFAGLGRGLGALGRGAGVVGAAVGAGMIIKDMATPEFWQPFGKLGQKIIETDVKIAKAVVEDLQKKANALLQVIGMIPEATQKASTATGELGNSFARSATVGREHFNNLITSIGQLSDGLAARVEPAFQEMAAGITRQLAAASDGLKNQIGFESKVWDEFFAGIYDSFGASLDAKVAQIKEKGLGKTLKNDFEYESKVWDKFFLGLYEDFGKGLEDKVKQLGKAMGDGLSNAVSGLKSIANGMITIVENAVNAAANVINARIREANAVLQQLRIPYRIPFTAPTVQLPRFARGGWVDRATVAEIGEGGDPGGEYAIPARQMPAAIEAWQQGRRGHALVAAMQSGGLAPGSSIPGGGGGGGAATGGDITINVPPAQIRIGQSIAMGGQDYVTVGELQATLANRDRQWVALVTSPNMRARLGR